MRRWVPSMQSVNPLWLIIFSFGAALLPTLAAVGTSYLKISIVLGLLRNALGTQQVPGSLVTLSLALGMTLFIMQPVFEQVHQQAAGFDFKRLAEGPSELTLRALRELGAPWKKFLVAHAGKKELMTLQSLAARKLGGDNGAAAVTVPEVSVVGYGLALSAFVVSELRRAFVVGFVVMLPFAAIDLIVANILVGLGMFMVSPMLVSLPIKLLLFIAADGWLLLTQSLILSYQI